MDLSSDLFNLAEQGDFKQVTDPQTIKNLLNVIQSESSKLDAEENQTENQHQFFVIKETFGKVETVFFISGLKNENSILNMIEKMFGINDKIRRYVESTITCAARILHMFTTDNIDKTIFFFILLDIENVLISHTTDLVTCMTSSALEENPLV